MKYNVYLLNYNNYKNRQVKKLESINEYNNGGYILSSIPSVNFEMNDGISTKIIINSSFATIQPDYILVEDIQSRVIDLEGNLISSDFTRWFVIDTNLIRGNQYEFTLRRDVWVDHYDVAMNSTYFIERGYVPDSSDLIFNDEGQKYSQIKKSQTLLKDETYGPWIVGYIPRKTGKDSDTTISTSVYSADADIAVSNLASWSYNSYVNNWVYSDETTMPYMARFEIPIDFNISGLHYYQRLYMGVDCKNKIATNDLYVTLENSQDPGRLPVNDPNFVHLDTGLYALNETQAEFITDKNNYRIWYNAVTGYATYMQVVDKAIIGKITSTMRSNYNAYSTMLNRFRNLNWLQVNNSVYNDIQNNLSGKTIKDLSTNKVYRITANTEDFQTQYKWTSGDTAYEALWDSLYAFVPASVTTSIGDTATLYGSAPTNYDDTIRTEFDLKRVKITLEEVANVSTVLPKDDQGGVIYRQHLVDAPYDMFAIPYTDELTVKDGVNTLNPNKEISIATAMAFITELGAENVYDLQILPYCPVRQYIQSDHSFDITASSNTQVRPITLGGTTVSYVFYCSKSTFEIESLLNPNDSFNPYSITNEDMGGSLKRSFNLDKYRLCSPNFASAFEFSPAQNGGVSHFKVSCTYKPYTPYIRVRPYFKRMFGNDYQDARGLILQGDFSLPKVTSAWTEYELNNKNYMNAFNREIQSLELQHKIGSIADWFKGISGVLTGAVGGTVAGQYAGGNVGSIVGAGIGTALSAVGGALDITNNMQLRNDVLTKAKDLFTYNLQNIQALPYSLTNVGCLTIDNPLIPILEYYTASDDEIDAFEKKMQYYGMAVMKVGQIADFLNPLGETFLQGQLLRVLNNDDNLECDNHLATELGAEISKGLYIGEYIPQGS